MKIVFMLTVSDRQFRNSNLFFMIFSFAFQNTASVL